MNHSLIFSRRIKVSMGGPFWKIKNKIASVQSNTLCALVVLCVHSEQLIFSEAVKLNGY